MPYQLREDCNRPYAATARGARHASHQVVVPLRRLGSLKIARLIVICGPSGTGKGTLVRRLVREFPDLIVSVSATTRAQRPDETDGVEYHFLSRDEFLRGIEEGRFLEWAEYGGNYYGTPLEPVEKALQAGRDVILEIEREGARQVMEQRPEAIGIFILPPSLEELERRLRGRNTESEESIARRLRCAEVELREHHGSEVRQGPHFDYAILNDDLEQATQDLCRLVRQIRGLRTTG